MYDTMTKMTLVNMTASVSIDNMTNDCMAHDRTTNDTITR